jgi:hypothetical protein
MTETWSAVAPMTVAAAPGVSSLRMAGAALLCVALVALSSHSGSSRDGLLQTGYPQQYAQARLAHPLQLAAGYQPQYAPQYAPQYVPQYAQARPVYAGQQLQDAPPPEQPLPAAEQPPMVMGEVVPAPVALGGEVPSGGTPCANVCPVLLCVHAHVLFVRKNKWKSVSTLAVQVVFWLAQQRFYGRVSRVLIRGRICLWTECPVCLGIWLPPAGPGRGSGLRV